MGKVTVVDLSKDDPIFKEGPQSYNPHWSRNLVRINPKPKTGAPDADLNNDQTRTQSDRVEEK